jgi:ABC-2 type transport system permease protein
LCESIIYSSWAFAILSFPIFFAFGQAKEVGPGFYFFSLLLVVPFLLIPAGLGALLTMLISAYFPARKTRTLALVLAVISVVIIVVMAKLMGVHRVLTSPLSSFDQIMGVLNVGGIPLLPNFWLTRGLVSLADKDYSQFLYWFLTLSSTALISLEVCYWLAPRIYYKGWSLSRQAASKTYASAAPGKFSAYDVFDKCYSFLPRRWAPLIRKDIRTFWRDPAQWSQLLILFGLLFIYIANLRSAAQQATGIAVLIPRWKTILSFFNIGASCFVLSILTTRFVYPMLSLEGKQQWAIGLSPLKRTAIVWEKYWLTWSATFILALVLMTFSNIMLQVDAMIFIISIITVMVMSFALISLAVGLGALMPNFKEDNPARIANGLGGTLNAILSLVYVGITLALEVVPAYLYSVGVLRLRRIPLHIIILYGGSFILLQLSIIVVPMVLGLRNWRRIEF